MLAERYKITAKPLDQKLKDITIIAKAWGLKGDVFHATGADTRREVYLSTRNYNIIVEEYDNESA